MTGGIKVLVSSAPYESGPIQRLICRYETEPRQNRRRRALSVADTIAARPTSASACSFRRAMRGHEPLAVKLTGRVKGQVEAVRQPARLRMDGHELSRYEG